MLRDATAKRINKEYLVAKIVLAAPSMCSQPRPRKPAHPILISPEPTVHFLRNTIMHGLHGDWKSTKMIMLIKK